MLKTGQVSSWENPSTFLQNFKSSLKSECQQTPELEHIIINKDCNVKMSSSSDSDILLETRKNGVTTLTMNRPKQLNGWTAPMMMAIRDSFLRLAKDSDTKVAILTGKDPYYCAGVNLSSTLKPMHPQKLHGLIVQNNAAIFNAFIEFPKPIIVAANGPAIRTIQKNPVW